MTPVEWQEPPQTRTGWSKWAGVAEQLRSRPGQWALIEKATTKAGLSGNINSGPQTPSVRVESTPARTEGLNFCDSCGREFEETFCTHGRALCTEDSCAFECRECACEIGEDRKAEAAFERGRDDRA